MDYLQFFGLIGTIIGATLWFKNQTDTLIREIQAEVKGFHQDIKDFHGRLCTLEEKNKEKR